MGATNPQLLTVSIDDPPAAWSAAGFSVDDAGRCGLGATTLVLAGDRERASTGITGWALAGVDESVDGLRSCAAVRGGPVDHANGIVTIDHVVVHSERPDHAVGAFESAGLGLRGTRATTHYGSAMHQHFFWAGDVIVELIGPAEPDPGAPTGCSFVGLALVAADLDATAAHLGTHLSGPKDAVQPGRRIGGLRGAQLGISVPIAVMSPHPGGTASGGATETPD